MTKKVALIDYGLGNIYSVKRAIEYCGGEVTLVNHPEDILNAERVVLPGVGAFEDGMKGLEQESLAQAIKDYARTGRPLLGICLGMQMLATVSEEFGTHRGLNLIPGIIKPLPPKATDGSGIKIPHIGWSKIHFPTGKLSQDPLFKNTGSYPYVYLVHSFHFVPDEEKNVLAYYSFGGWPICAAVKHEQIYGCQFHPEKSGPVGLAMLKEFITPNFLRI